MSLSSVEPPQIIPENPTIPEPNSDDVSLYNPRKGLFKAAMNREWKTVCDLYRKDEKVQGEHITRANDTLLHVAVSGATEKIILDLLVIVEKNKEMRKILKLQNKAGDTPLHLAAALGLEKVCRKMTTMCPDMVTSARNNLQETPLFLAVRHGKKNTFFVLETAIHKEQKMKIDEGDSLSVRDITHCRRDDGNNILHHAIKGEQFGTPIMKELVDRSTLWEYEEASGGQQPAVSALPSDIGSKSPPSVGTTDLGLHENTPNPSEGMLTSYYADLGLLPYVNWPASDLQRRG